MDKKVIILKGNCCPSLQQSLKLTTRLKVIKWNAPLNSSQKAQTGQKMNITLVNLAVK